MSSPAEVLLSRLQSVRRRRAGHWLTACPAHDDRGPSLSVAETDGGTVLIHCFAGCTPVEVVAAVGLTLADLFADKLEHHGGRRPPMSAAW